MDGGQRPAASPFDLILLDVHLPRMTGLDLLSKIRTDPLLYLTPVVMLSCSDDDAVAADCLDAGANAFVTKARDPGAFSDFHCSDCRFLGQRMPRPQTTRLLSEIAD